MDYPRTMNVSTVCTIFESARRLADTLMRDYIPFEVKRVYGNWVFQFQATDLELEQLTSQIERDPILREDCRNGKDLYF